MTQSRTANDKIEIIHLGEECYRRIKNNILSGQLSWGQKLNVIQLAEQYGISRSPVVKAIDRLSMEGLATIFPNRGSFVLIPQEEDIVEVMEVYEIMETALLRMAVKNNRADLITDLSQLNLGMAALIGKGEEDKNKELFLEYDRDFHHILCQYAGNSRLKRISTSTRSQVDMFYVHALSIAHVEETIQKHAAVIENLAGGQVHRAIAEFAKHIQDKKSELLQYLSNHGESYQYS